MTKRLRYGIIGAGSNAEKKHVQGYKNLPEVEFAAVCDSNAERAAEMAKRHCIPGIYTNYKEMIEREKLDLVSVVTPNFLHAEIVEYALLHGVHVHCEKPLCTTVEEAERILSAKERSGKRVMIGLNNRFTNEAVYLKQWIDAGHLGTIYSAKAGWVRRSGIPGRGTWFTNRKLSGGGVMIDLGTHYLDLCLYMMGMPEPSYMAGAAYRNFVDSTSRNRNGYKGDEQGVFDVEDTAEGYLRLANGASVMFEFSWASNIEQDQHYIELRGTKGGASLKNGELRIFGEHEGVCVDLQPKLYADVKRQDEFRHFIDCLLDEGRELMAPPEDGLILAKLAEAFYASAETKQPVVLRT
ncbi:Gfo/Idh/MocA family protein [Cohnella fermenti]|uniref:Gfo/Idh/MocA family oxidoreductase n=1 Tax=Cohnella fermenti TaxID=2565925 RepID=A0A4S4BKH3_9BACL|nr:Gfo/Idh/MocA family oxidoreductase [Cohnella fermenti]THF75229.1 Gfo/Idh/MocA family oxidoreductase [Cohnella fermenti]